MDVVASLVTALVAGVMLWAGLEKLHGRRSFQQTLAALGVPAALQVPVGYLIPAAEVVTALGLLMQPGRGWPPLAVGVLAVGFAAAGVVGLRSGRRIACACLGASGDGVLGWRQVLLLPAWVAVAAALNGMDRSWSWQTGLQYTAGLLVLLATIRGTAVWVAWRAAAAARQAINEAAVVRRPIFLAGSTDGGMA